VIEIEGVRSDCAQGMLLGEFGDSLGDLLEVRRLVKLFILSSS
jgi:hypothetical protein